jgi:transposase-like protein
MADIPKKRTQKDYSLSLKLQVVKELELGELTRVQAMDKYGIQAGSTIRSWLKKYGNFDYHYTVNQSKEMNKTPEQRILELEQELILSKKLQARLEYQLSQTNKKVVLFDMMINMAEEEFNIPIRKKSEPELLKHIASKNKKA